MMFDTNLKCDKVKVLQVMIPSYNVTRTTSHF